MNKVVLPYEHVLLYEKGVFALQQQKHMQQYDNLKPFRVFLLAQVIRIEQTASMAQRSLSMTNTLTQSKLF